MRVDGENRWPRTYQQNILIADVAEQGLAAEVIQCNALREVRSGRRGLLFSHVPSIIPAIPAYRGR
jgi:hypothetical protein